MLTKTIGQLSAATSIADSDLIEIEQSGVSKYISAEFLIPIGATLPFAGAVAPSGWLICDGSAVSRATYVNLFGVISDTWGVGDGSTTFNIPDLREAAPVGIGTSASLITSTGSAISAHDTYTLGQFKDDAIQGHWHQSFKSTANNAIPSLGAGSQLPYDSQFATPGSANGDWARQAKTDGVNGTPRDGAVTRGKRVGVNYIIKY